MQTATMERARAFDVPALRWLPDLLRAMGRRMSQSRGDAERHLRIDERVSIGPKKSLLLVSCCGQRVLVAVAGETVTMLLALDTRKPPKTTAGTTVKTGSRTTSNQPGKASRP
jgi:flagellar biogenesis protein FliO